MTVNLPQNEILKLRKKFYDATVTDIIEVQPALWIFRIKPDAGLPSCKPGQYTTIGLGYWEKCVEGNAPEILKPGEEKKLLRRAYSISHPVVKPDGKLYKEGEYDFFEFYVALVLIGGETPTPPRLTPRLFALKKGDRLSLGPKVTGHYHLEKPYAGNQYFFFSTGTGEAPHNAMVWQLLSGGFQGPIVNCVCTRYRIDQAYRTIHEKLAKEHPNYKVIYLATREKDEPKLYCQDLVEQGLFEKKTGYVFDSANTHVYLCGNPSMIGRPEVVDGKKIYPKPKGIIEILESRGFSIHSPTQSGNIHFEAYW